MEKLKNRFLYALIFFGTLFLAYQIYLLSWKESENKDVANSLNNKKMAAKNTIDNIRDEITNQLTTSPQSSTEIIRKAMAYW